MSATCTNHPRRDAIGVCIVCRAQVCSECVTKVDGINHCVRCYATLAERAPSSAGGASSLGAAWLTGIAWTGVAVVLVWALLEVALPGAG